MPLSTQAKARLLVPDRALGVDQGGRYVLVVNDEDVVEHRRVVMGQKAGDLRVIQSGLEPDDRVVINGMLRARPGSKVTPQTAETKSTEGSEAPEGAEPAAAGRRE